METEAYTQDTPILWVVPLANLIEVANPMEADIWDCGVITEKDVLSCFHFHHASYSYDNEHGFDTTSREYNIARIAYIAEYQLYKHNPNDPHPISVELGEWVTAHPILDGNHRIASAHIMGEEFITVEISGDIEYARELLKPVEYLSE